MAPHERTPYLPPGLSLVDKPWGSLPPSEYFHHKPLAEPDWLFSNERPWQNTHGGHLQVARANMGASRPPLRTLNVMEGIRQLHKATLLKTRLDAVFAKP